MISLRPGDSPSTPGVPPATPGAPPAGVRARAVARRIAGAPAAVSLVGALLLTTLVMLAVGVDPALAYPALLRGALWTATSNTPWPPTSPPSAWPRRSRSPPCGRVQPGRRRPARAGRHHGRRAGPVHGGAGSFAVPLAGAVLAGALLAALSAPLRTRLGVPAIVSTLLLSAPAVSLASYLARFPLAEQGTGLAQTPLLPDAARLPALGGSTYLTIGLPLVAVLAVLWLFADARTVPGYEIRALGANREFARYGGVRVNRLAALTLAAGGAFGGLVGGLIVLGAPTGSWTAR
ncbi:hypothetical protein ACFQ0B_54680 [Nonomuraea thailandensis]